MISIYVHQHGDTTCADSIDPDWLRPGSPVTLWVDLAAPTPEENAILNDVFHFHPLAVEDALSATKAAVAEGIVPGGGLALLRLIDAVAAEEESVTGDERTCGMTATLCGISAGIELDDPALEEYLSGNEPSADQLEQLLGVYLGQFNDILTSDIPAFNSVAQNAGTPTIFGGPTIEVKK